MLSLSVRTSGGMLSGSLDVPSALKFPATKAITDLSAFGSVLISEAETCPDKSCSNFSGIF